MYATDGDDTLGGSDLDLCLFKILTHRILETTGVDITTAATGTASTASAASAARADQASELCTAPAVHTMAEEIKKSLTYNSEVPFRCVFPAAEVNFFLIYAFFSLLVFCLN